MKPLKIDLLPRQLGPVWALLLNAMALSIALAISLWVWSEYRDADVRLQQLEAAQRSHGEVEMPVPRPGGVALPYEADAGRAAIASAFQTSQALTALEHVVMAGVTPVSVELETESGLGRVEVEFADQQVLLKYLEELNAGEADPRWQLLRATARGASQGMGLAVLEARW